MTRSASLIFYVAMSIFILWKERECPAVLVKSRGTDQDDHNIMGCHEFMQINAPSPAEKTSQYVEIFPSNLVVSTTASSVTSFASSPSTSLYRL